MGVDSTIPFGLNGLPMKTVLAFGETLWDLLPGGAVLGGAPCNFAHRANSLGDRGLVVTRLGRDELGRKAREALAALGMDASLVQWDDARPTGTVPVTVDARGVPDFTIVPDVAYDRIEPDAALLAEAAKADCVCFGTLVQRSPRSRATLARVLEAAPRALKFLDINLRKGCWTPETVRSSLERADVLKLNDAEALALRGVLGLRGKSVPALARELRRRWRLEACVVTLGEKGAFAVSEKEEAELPGLRVEVADTIGSGDAFSAAFVSLRLRGRSLEDCCRFGNALGALVATRKGATAPVGIEEIERLAGRPLRPLLA
jgi:fructokinase